METAEAPKSCNRLDPATHDGISLAFATVRAINAVLYCCAPIRDRLRAIWVPVALETAVLGNSSRSFGCRAAVSRYFQSQWRWRIYRGSHNSFSGPGCGGRNNCQRSGLAGTAVLLEMAELSGCLAGLFCCRLAQLHHVGGDLKTIPLQPAWPRPHRKTLMASKLAAPTTWTRTMPPLCPKSREVNRAWVALLRAGRPNPAVQTIPIELDRHYALR
jgi:hypothetical protein